MKSPYKALAPVIVFCTIMLYFGGAYFYSEFLRVFVQTDKHIFWDVMSASARAALWNRTQNRGSISWCSLTVTSCLWWRSAGLAGRISCRVVEKKRGGDESLLHTLTHEEPASSAIGLWLLPAQRRAHTLLHTDTQIDTPRHVSMHIHNQVRTGHTIKLQIIARAFICFSITEPPGSLFP